MSSLFKLMNRGLLLLALTGSLFAASRNAEIKVKAGDLKGTVTNAVGKTAEAVRLTLTKAGKVVATVETDAAGKYAFQGVAAGEYGLSVAKVMNFTLSVRPDGTVSSLRIVLPEGYNAAQQGGADIEVPPIDPVAPFTETEHHATEDPPPAGPVMPGGGFGGGAFGGGGFFAGGGGGLGGLGGLLGAAGLAGAVGYTASNNDDDPPVSPGP